MKIATIVVLCTAFGHSMAAQSANDSVATHRARFSDIERNRSRYRIAEVSRKNLDLDGGVDADRSDGTITAYCEGNDIRLIVSSRHLVTVGEEARFHRSIDSYYYHNDSLFFAYHKDGWIVGFDDSSQKMPWSNEERAYFANGKLIRLLDESPDGSVKNVAEDPTSFIAKRRAAAILSEAAVYRGLMGGCVPYVPVLTDTSSVAENRAVFDEIERNRAKYRSVRATSEELGLKLADLHGTWLEAYCAGNDVVLILDVSRYDSARTQRSYYFDHGSLSFAFFRVGYGSSETGQAVDEERLYFRNGTLIRWLGEQNRPHDIATPQARDRAATVLSEARDYRQLMAQCIPHPRQR